MLSYECSNIIFVWMKTLWQNHSKLPSVTINEINLDHDKQIDCEIIHSTYS